MTTPRKPPVLIALSLLLISALLAGCGQPPPGQPEPSSTPSPTKVASAPKPAKVGSCHRLSFEQAASPVVARGRVPCSKKHTSITIATGRLDLQRDGRLLSVDADAVRAPLDGACRRALQKYVAGDQSDLALSQLRAVWFTPSLEQADRGAQWYRCDLVALAGTDKLIGLPTSVKGVFGSDAEGTGASAFATCGKGTPGKTGFTKVPCSSQHDWRAESIFEFGAEVKYLAKEQGEQGNQACKDRASDDLDSSLRYSWTFLWPTKQNWMAGERYGVCWLPR